MFFRILSHLLPIARSQLLPVINHALNLMGMVIVRLWLTCEDIVPAVPVKPGVCLWTTLRANKNIKTNFIPIHIVTRIFDATTIMPSSPSQKIYHHLVKCQHHNCHCYVCYHDQHLPLNFIAFSVSKSPLPSTCTPTSSSFRYT